MHTLLRPSFYFNGVSLFSTLTLLIICPSIPAFAIDSKPQAVTSVDRSFATQINTNNADQLILKGPDAIGGIGDWFFTNGTLCAIVSGVNHEGEFSTKGGSLVDLGFCGRADEHFSFAHDLLQSSRKRPLNTDEISIEQNKRSSTIIVNGHQQGVAIETRLTLSQDLPTQLHINKKISLSNEKAESFNYFSPLIFNLHSLEPFVLNKGQVELSNGFAAQEFVSRGISAMEVSARDADTIITTSPNYPDQSDADDIAYGWHLAYANRIEGDDITALPRFMFADATSTAMLILADDFYVGDGSKIGWLQLPQIPLLSLDQDSVIETKEVIYVGKNNNVSSITDQFWGDMPLLSGRVNEANVGIHVLSLSNKPITFVRSDANGKFSLRLPFKTPSKYKLKLLASANRQVDQLISVSSENLPLSTINLPPASKVSLPQGQAMRLLFVGVNGTEQPDFSNQLTNFTIEDDDGIHKQKAVSNIFLAGKKGDVTEVDLAPGEYQVFATRGPEYSLEKAFIVVQANTTQKLNIKTPTRQLLTPNFIASDLHVHSGLSFDNAFSETERVRSFVAEHGEVMVSSEHDLPVDYAPRIAQLGVQDSIISIPAAEVTSLLPTKNTPYTNGHANFFPYQPDKHAYRRGMVNHEGKRWREVMHSLRQAQPDVIVQMNHPRRNMSLSSNVLPDDWQDIIDNGQFLDHMGSAGHPYNPHKPLHSHPNNTLIEKHEHTGVRDIDFDLMEIINPGGIYNTERIQAQRLDWLSFLKQGELIVGTANSDSHHANEQVALPRTMVAMSNDSVKDFNQSEFLKSLKSGNAYGTTGPMLNLNLSDAQMGQTFSGQRGQLSINIKSADWIPLSTLKVQINGITVDQYTLDDDPSHDYLIPLSFDKDSFVTIEVEGPASEDYQRVYPDLTPYAFSNPIYVDFDGDGVWIAPGLLEESSHDY